jgi:tRNA(fMet)-specific endonuclease VapC
MTTPQLMIDTNIVSYLMRGQAEARLYSGDLKGKILAISFVTVGELFYGAEKAGWGPERKLKMETTLRNFVIIPYDYEISRRYALVLVGREREGRPISSNDAWIAASDVRHSVPFVTHNAKDFENIQGLEIITKILTR